MQFIVEEVKEDRIRPLADKPKPPHIEIKTPYQPKLVTSYIGGDYETPPSQLEEELPI